MRIWLKKDIEINGKTKPQGTVLEVTKSFGSLLISEDKAIEVNSDADLTLGKQKKLKGGK